MKILKKLLNCYKKDEKFKNRNNQIKIKFLNTTLSFYT